MCNLKLLQTNPITYQRALLTFKGNKKLSRHIKLNHINIALLLQEATQKYRKLTDY